MPSVSRNHVALATATFPGEYLLALGSIACNPDRRVRADGSQVGNQRPGFTVFKCIGRHFRAGNSLADGPKDLRITCAVNPDTRREIRPTSPAARVRPVAWRAISAKQRCSLFHGHG